MLETALLRGTQLYGDYEAVRGSYWPRRTSPMIVCRALEGQIEAWPWFARMVLRGINIVHLFMGSCFWRCFAQFLVFFCECDSQEKIEFARNSTSGVSMISVLDVRYYIHVARSIVIFPRVE